MEVALNENIAYISRFITTAVAPKGYPPADAPEIAFVGRSNVGKSSLINAMLNRKKLARTSGTPGKTRVINFFGVKEKEADEKDKVVFVDLPGYGYAKAPKTEMQSWGKMAEEYLKNRASLAAIVLLLDLRRVPSVEDAQMYEWLNFYEKQVIIVGTKADKLNRRETQAAMRVMSERLNLPAGTEIIAFSSVKRTGVARLWEAALFWC